MTGLILHIIYIGLCVSKFSAPIADWTWSGLVEAISFRDPWFLLEKNDTTYVRTCLHILNVWLAIAIQSSCVCWELLGHIFNNAIDLKCTNATAMLMPFDIFNVFLLCQQLPTGYCTRRRETLNPGAFKSWNLRLSIESWCYERNITVKSKRSKTCLSHESRVSTWETWSE